jgi:dCTP deaminase
MSSLVDSQIENLARCSALVVPYNPEQLNPGSYDVVLGDTLLLERGPWDQPRGFTSEPWATHDIGKSTYWLQPGEFVLAHTAELVNIPKNLEAVFCLKSSRGREGYNHALAAYIDPGYSGRITLELKNYRQHTALPLYAGLRIGQLRFTTMDITPRKSYNVTGRYQNDKTVTPSKG